MVLQIDINDSLQQLCAIEVLGVGRIGGNHYYLVLFDDQKNHLLSSAAAQKICPIKVIEFYMKNCYFKDNNIFVPSECVIGM